MITKKQACVYGYQPMIYLGAKANICDPFSINMLVNSTDVYNRFIMASNKSLSFNFASKLLYDEDIRVRNALVHNNKDEAILQNLACDKNTSISLAARISLARLREQ